MVFIRLFKKYKNMIFSTVPKLNYFLFTSSLIAFAMTKSIYTNVFLLKVIHKIFTIFKKNKNKKIIYATYSFLNREKKNPNAVIYLQQNIDVVYSYCYLLYWNLFEMRWNRYQSCHHCRCYATVSVILVVRPLAIL